MKKRLTLQINEARGTLDVPMDDVQLLRQVMNEEMEAVTLYENMLKQARDPRVKTMLQSLVHEEKVHFGEAETLLEVLDPKHEEAEEEGEEEVEDMTGMGESTILLRRVIRG